MEIREQAEENTGEEDSEKEKKAEECKKGLKAEQTSIACEKEAEGREERLEIEEKESNGKKLLNLSLEILKRIRDRLYLIDYTNFRFASTLCRETTPPLQFETAISRSETQNKSLSPWLVSLQESGLLCNLAHPDSSNRYRVHVPKFLRDATLWHSKDSWLLVSNLQRKIHILSFFNPFTKCVEKYKGLFDLFFTTSSIAFSSPPPSPNCVIVVIKVCGVRRVLICICHSKAKPLREFSQISNEDFLPADANPIFANGAFYFLGRHGNVGVMRLKDGGCIWHVLERPQVLRPSFSESFLAEHDGEVYLVLKYEMGKDVQVLILDTSTLSWNTVENLGNHTLHVSRSSALCTVAKTSEAGNKIYIPRFMGSI